MRAEPGQASAVTAAIAPAPTAAAATIPAWEVLAAARRSSRTHPRSKRGRRLDGGAGRPPIWHRL